MVRKTMVIFALICVVTVNTSSANVFSGYLMKLVGEALKSVGTEAGKAVVDRFKALFNKNNEIARNNGNPKISGGEVKGKERIWVVSPAGSLSKDDIREIARVLRFLDNERDQRINVKINNEDLSVMANQTGINIQRLDIRGDNNTTSSAQGPSSISIALGSGSTLNFIGVPPEQAKTVLKSVSLADEALKNGQSSAEEAKKNIEVIDKELSKIKREKFGSLPEDAKKWVQEMSALLVTFRQREALLQGSLQKQAEYRENLSKQMVTGIRKLFVEILGIIDSRVLALEEAKDWGIKYARNTHFQLFLEEGSPGSPTSVGNIFFKNGSLVAIVLLPGILVQGIAQRPPELRFLKVINGQPQHAFSFIEKKPTGSIMIGPPPLVSLPSKKQQLTDVIFDPKQNDLGHLREEFISTFTQFIGSVITSDNLLKPDHK